MACLRCSDSHTILDTVSIPGVSFHVPCPLCSGGRELRPPVGDGRYEPSLPVRGSFKAVLIGEAWGEEEERQRLPFVGPTGYHLNQMLEEAGIARSDLYVTNVFNLRPRPTNDIKNLTCRKAESTVPMPPLGHNFYLQDKYYPEVQRLWRELEALRPNLIIAMGNTALWAVTGNFGIRKQRGAVTHSQWPAGLKVLPTYHPTAVMREWSLRTVVVADLMKAKREMRFPEVRRPKRTLWLSPGLSDIALFYDKYVRPCTQMAFDIETMPMGGGQITCVGFAPSKTLGIVIPFVDWRQPNGSYWRSAHDEASAWRWVKVYLNHNSMKIGQNTLYDINWLWSRMGITVRNYNADTMLLAHAISPEHEKSLGFLGSIHTDEPAWKIMRTKGLFSMKKGE